MIDEFIFPFPSYPSYSEFSNIRQLTNKIWVKLCCFGVGGKFNNIDLHTIHTISNERNMDLSLRRTRTRIKSIISNGICENLLFRRLYTRQMPNLYINSSLFFIFHICCVCVCAYIQSSKLPIAMLCVVSSHLISSCLSNCDYVLL